MYVPIVSHLPTSIASDIVSVWSQCYVFKFHTDLLYWSSVLLLCAALYVKTVPTHCQNILTVSVV